MSIPIIDETDGNTLFKNDIFLETYRKMTDNLIKLVDFSEFKYYKYGQHKENTGVLFFYKEEWIWSWVNTINTNYSCFYLMVNRANLIIKDILKNDRPYVNFIDSKDKIKELHYLFEILTNYKQELFTPKYGSKKNSLFNLMRFKTMDLWYGSKMSEVYVVSNMICFFDDLIGHELDFRRGDKDDMTKGKDFGIIRKIGKKSIQHKNDRLLKYENDYYYFNTLLYSEKNYGSVDYLSITNKQKDIFLFENSKDRSLCGMFILPNGKKHFRIHKSLKIEPKKLLKMSLTKNLEELLKFCGKHNINFHMENNNNVELNTIEYTDNPEPNIHIEYTNLDDDTFPDKVNLVLEDLKQRFK